MLSWRSYVNPDLGSELSAEREGTLDLVPVGWDHRVHGELRGTGSVEDRDQQCQHRIWAGDLQEFGFLGGGRPRRDPLGGVVYARRIDLDALPINERKAALLLDVTRAFLMWGKHEQALHTMRAVGQIAPEEITGRPQVHQLVGDLVVTAPITVRREAREFADAYGIAA